MTDSMARVPKEEVTVSVDPGLLAWLDGLVQAEAYESRSAAMEAAIEAMQQRFADERFRRALAEVTPEDVAEQQAMAEEGMGDWSEIVAANEW
jgi:Arc/MetJ-type ribon-helix-helix transcriptional regulator